MGREHSEPQGGWLKMHRSAECRYLLKNKPNAFLLLTLIAGRAKYHNKNGDDSLRINEAYIGDHQSCGLTRQKYRTAITILVDRKHIVTRRVKNGFIAKLISTDVFNPTSLPTRQPTNIKDQNGPLEKAGSLDKKEPNNHLNNHYDNHKQEIKENKETTTTKTSMINNDVVDVLNKYQIVGTKAREIANHPLAEAKLIDDICYSTKISNGRQGAMVNRIFAVLNHRKSKSIKPKKKRVIEIVDRDSIKPTPTKELISIKADIKKFRDGL